MRFIYIASVIICSVACTNYAGAVSKDSQLTQAIEPILCVYTDVAQGSGQSLSTTCQNQSVPTVETITANDRFPIITGIYPSAESISLSVYIDEDKYTLGVNPELTSIVDDWRLDLHSLSTALPAGNYTITVETLHQDSILLQSVYTMALHVPVREVVETRTETGSGHTVSRLERNPRDGTYHIYSESDDLMALGNNPLDPGNLFSILKMEPRRGTASGINLWVLIPGLVIVVTVSLFFLFLLKRRRRN